MWWWWLFQIFGTCYSEKACLYTCWKVDFEYLPPHLHSICVPQCIFLHLCHMFCSQHILVPSSDFSIHVLNCGSDIGFLFDNNFQKNINIFLPKKRKSESEITWLPISVQLSFPLVTPVTWVSVVCNQQCGWLLAGRPRKVIFSPT